jgi:hypothetical protein
MSEENVVIEEKAPVDGQATSTDEGGSEGTKSEVMEDKGSREIKEESGGQESETVPYAKFKDVDTLRGRLANELGTARKAAEDAKRELELLKAKERESLAKKDEKPELEVKPFTKDEIAQGLATDPVSFLADYQSRGLALAEKKAQERLLRIRTEEKLENTLLDKYPGLSDVQSELYKETALVMAEYGLKPEQALLAASEASTRLEKRNGTSAQKETVAAGVQKAKENPVTSPAKVSGQASNKMSPEEFEMCKKFNIDPVLYQKHNK